MFSRFLVVVAVAGIIFTLFTQNNPDSAAAEFPEAVAAPIDPAMRQMILDATLHIEMSDYTFSSETRATGLATLVSQDGQVVVVTHDHWPLLEAEHGRVHFRNTESLLLADISVAQFRQLIRHQDEGTLILDLPPQILVEFVSAVPMPRGSLPSGGDAVLVVHQAAEAQPGDSINLIVSRAIVQDVTAKGGLPVFILKNAEGHAIVPGDSGGGIWCQGQLVGNMWSTVMEVSTGTAGGDGFVAQPRSTAISIAAQLTLDRYFS